MGLEAVSGPGPVNRSPNWACFPSWYIPLCYGCLRDGDKGGVQNESGENIRRAVHSSYTCIKTLWPNLNLIGEKIIMTEDYELINYFLDIVIII